MTEPIEIELPEDGTIGSAPILGGESATPGGVEIFGGADLVTVMSADGWLYIIYCGERAGHKFGTHCFRQGPQGQLEWVELGVFTEGRAGATLEPNGLFLSWPLGRGNRLMRIQLPGFVTPGFPTSGQAAPAPPPTLAPPPPTTGGSLVDEGARAYTGQVKKELQGVIREQEARIKALEARLAALESRPSQINVEQLRDVIWNLPVVVDRVYAELRADNPGLVEQVSRIARQATQTP